MYTKYDNYIIKMRGKTYTPIQVIQSPKNPDRLQVKYQVPVMNKSNLNNTYVVTFINEDTPKARVPDLIHRTGKYVEITFNYVNINIHNNFVIDNRKVDKNMTNDLKCFTNNIQQVVESSKINVHGFELFPIVAEYNDDTKILKLAYNYTPSIVAIMKTVGDDPISDEIASSFIKYTQIDVHRYTAEEIDNIKLNCNVINDINEYVSYNMSNDNATLYNINIIDGNTFVAYVIDNASKDEIQMKFQYHI